MSSIQRLITAINKNPRDNSHESIQRFGGVFLNIGLLSQGQQWEASFNEAIAMAQLEEEFFVRGVDGKTLIPVRLHTSRFGNLYLRSDSDGLLGDNLLSLPELHWSRGLIRGGLINAARFDKVANPTQGFGIGMVNTPQSWSPNSGEVKAK